MKRFNFLLLCVTALLLAACCKEDAPDGNDNVPGLPPATQSGRNTLGFLLNGQPWTPAGSDGTANLSIDYDPGFNNGVVGINAYRVLAPGNVQDFGLGVTDSLNFQTAPINYVLTRTSLFNVSFKQGFCDNWSRLNEVTSNGVLTISKLDRTARIIAGTFEATLYRNGCDTVRITNGRFDMKF